ncbi:MAG: hypothetical protein FWD47_05180 [Treponema sp.]|nr:hypothetical protein [Treponema sp.]
MKQVFKTFKMFFFVIMIGLFFTTCDDVVYSGAGGNNFVYLGNTLTLSGQVYHEYTYQPFTGNLSIFCEYGGQGQIINGVLNYSIGVPTNLDPIYYYFNGEANDDFLIITPSRNVNVVILEGLTDYYYYKLAKVRNTESTEEELVHIYVDNDVTLNVVGYTDNFFYEGIYWTYIGYDNTLPLKKGWNALYLKREIFGTSTHKTAIFSLELKNPSIPWIIW